MPNTRSAKKALRQAERRHTRNLQQSRRLKEAIKRLKKAITNKKKEEASALLPQVYKTLDKAAKTGIIKKNTASRKKARLSRAVNKEL
ncbi:MAG: 30S ribosomal protein S20 [Candidatus Ryanbacteria bacterium RIFCSPHIGHO2_02_FULL_45_43]|uniref:Small ribosomal subunit protein bS20 n=1 Tax=Candidatus Ryanbacteria bacterium RIFCSPHIGHO2_01_45_13 TaxID=1802112 RepID=A0A1G2FXL2_9BACT|nr:MAG: 30S ribosomal protein S20 [Candidatus Ryanbacteria bacterium RIFCSPHIGHO2_01_FULL_44_130]OGZ42816.1 MAG: 30S ribosomal protein S20 [Candidatus Ryanbacteria bacterium RIFCSPHIGHO2_01_45_13]OGZ48238.1 MAG: 30S ribosomal protein S20 [Candidatus Ryanbacteria bacterium RIFCSPHIGHO2_02_FULL_45_43]OGZ50014.1 MAG: 30S ribosomal protein S20 [Candidatus Ryanbacteria bacterium RIFCSPHIGHO2_12_FULL_44_20]OGZ51473.1 MAG: 30S ribosomal protein S20 [Candidatus Ryanbacteria bacterium RIFCSPLOWO2_01_FUL